MMRSNSKKSGFMLMEVMIALVVMALIFGALFSLESSIMKRCMVTTRYLDRVMQAKNFLVASWLKTAFQPGSAPTITETLDNPQTVFAYTQEKVAQEGSYASFPFLYKHAVMFSWSEGGIIKSKKLVALSYFPHKKAQPS